MTASIQDFFTVYQSVVSAAHYPLYIDYNMFENVVLMIPNRKNGIGIVGMINDVSGHQSKTEKNSVYDSKLFGILA